MNAPPFVLMDYIPSWVIYLLVALIVIAAGIPCYWRLGPAEKGEETIDEKMLVPPYDRAIQGFTRIKGL